MKRIIAHLPFCTGLPRSARNDEAYNRHCEGVSPRQSSKIKCRSKNKAFSLIELLVSLIIISLIISSFIPILTSKLKHQNTTLSSGIINCKKFGSECILCDKTSCTLCSTQINLLDGQYVDSKTSCEVKNCPSNCKKCDKGECLECSDGFGLVDKTCKTCPNNCLKCSGTTCIQCKDDYSLNEGKCIKGSCLKIGSTCVQRFNAGDPGGLEIPADLVEMMSTRDDAITKEHNRAICYLGKTATECDDKTGGYSGCDRTVCTWYAAVKICAHYGLRLPTSSEAASFGINSIGKGEDGLQLCDESASALSNRCAMSKRCNESEYCYPNGLWCQRVDGKTVPPNPNSNPTRNGGVFYSLNGEWKRNYFYNAADVNHTCNAVTGSVRCVKDL